MSASTAEVREITGLVYVAAFAPEPGEDCNTLAGRFPGSTLGEALRPVPRSDGTTDLYITNDRSMPSSVPTCRRARQRGWPPPSGR